MAPTGQNDLLLQVALQKSDSERGLERITSDCHAKTKALSFLKVSSHFKNMNAWQTFYRGIYLALGTHF